MPPAETASAWLDRFFDSYYHSRPVNATFIGVHRFDHLLPDLSEAGAGDTLAEMEALLAAGNQIDPTDRTERLDLDLAIGFLETQIWEYRSTHFHRGNPSLYTGEAIFGLMSLFLTDFAPAAQRVEAAIARMAAIPALLTQGRRNVRQAPTAWTERAIRECQAGVAFLTFGISHLPDPVALTAGASPALEALAEYQAFLEGVLRPRPRHDVAAGEEALALYLSRGHFLDQTPDQIAEYAMAALAEAADPVSHSAALGDGSTAPRGPAAVPIAGEPDSYEQVWRDAKAAAIAHDLITWPDFPIRYRHRPVWAREAAADLYFLHYRSPAAFGPPIEHEYLIPEYDPGPEQIKLNHVVHHGGIGHHVQNWHASRAASRVARMAAVDCASRIAMFSAGTMAEGWACYATDLMGDVGFLTAAEQENERRARARMAARAVVDIRLHQGRMTLEQAAAFYRDRAGMPAIAAQAEAAKNSMFPGAALMYLFGTDAIHQLRRDLTSRRGPRFSLRQFHDEFLSHGSVPVTLIAKAMLESDDAR